MESLVAREFLHSTLSALPIAVHRQDTVFMESAVFPLCLYSVEPQADVRHKMGLSWSPVQSVVRVLNEGNVRDMEQYIAQADNLLSVGYAELEGGYIKGIRRLRVFDLPVFYRSGSNQPIYSIGGVYEMNCLAKESASA